MSISINSDDILFQQRLLRAEGLYSGRLDGVWGPLTEEGQHQFEQRSRRIADEEGRFDPRSEANIQSLSLKAQRLARRFLRKVLDHGIRARVISGTRTYAEQERLYGQGRFGNPGPIVTNAPAGHSNHNFGLAWDIGIFTPQNGFVTDGPEYDRAGESGRELGLEWGGDWHSIVDKPHFQLPIKLTLTELRVAFESGNAHALYA